MVDHGDGEVAGCQPDVRAALFFRIDPDDFADVGIGFENLAHGVEDARELRRRIDRAEEFFHFWCARRGEALDRGWERPGFNPSARANIRGCV